MGLFWPSKKEKLLQAEVERLTGLLTPEQQEIEYINRKLSDARENLSEMNAQIEKNEIIKNALDSDIQNLNTLIEDKKKELEIFDDEINAFNCGLYKPTYEFANSDLYKISLVKLREKQKQCIKNDKAVSGVSNWTVNGNASQGTKMVNNYKKLLLRAFNVECDDIVNNVKISNLDRSVQRIYKIKEQIEKLGSTMQITFSTSYVDMKISEVKLALDYQQKKLEEKERQKELRAQAKEEAKVLREIEEEKRRLSKEQSHYENALKTVLEQLKVNGETEELLAKKEKLENQIGDTQKAIENVDYREANQKAGYVYIISNIGAFGENVYKIGMTRRLDPQERVDELGDASVPFNFDVHAMIFSDNAPKLESALHNAFDSQKINKINGRREFFEVSLDEIKKVVRENYDKTVDWKDEPEAEQYRQSLLLKR